MPALVKAATRPTSHRAIPIVTPVKNEIKLIGEFLDHYRGIGAGQFHIIDNGSTDGTREYLLEQSDVALYEELSSFRAAGTGMDWVNALLHNVASDRWAIFADADEHLVYPKMDCIDIEQFAWGLDEKGFDTCRAIMLDMYHDKNLDDQSALAGGSSLKQTFQYFDKDYIIRRAPNAPWSPDAKRNFQIVGGPRYRIVSDIKKEGERSWIGMFLSGQIDRFINRVPESMLRSLFNMWPYYRTALQKRPLNRIHSYTRYTTNHDTNNQRIAPTMVALLHYGLCNELKYCLENDALQTEHYRRGLEKEQLRLGMLAWPHDTLIYEGSRRYESVQDVLDAGLIGDKYAEIVQIPYPSSCVPEHARIDY